MTASTTSMLPANSSPVVSRAAFSTTLQYHRPPRHGKAAADPPSLTASHLKDRLIRLLQSRRPRRARQVFLEALSHSSCPTNPLRTKQLEGFVHLFFRYRQPQAAMDAVFAMQERGFVVSGAVCVKLLRSAHDELVLQPERMGQVVEWLLEIIRSPHKGVALPQAVTGAVVESEDGADAEVEEGVLSNGRLSSSLVGVLMETLVRSGQPKLARDLFKAYADALPSKAMPPPMLYAHLLRAQGLPRAHFTFNDWRTRHLSSDTTLPPPVAPYAALLGMYARSGACRSALSRQHLRLIISDRVPLDQPIFYAWLQLELSRKNYRAFWKLFTSKIDSPELYDSSVWRVALKVKERQRLEQRREAVALEGHSADPVGDVGGMGLSYRTLFRLYLEGVKTISNDRPSLVLPSSKPHIKNPATLTYFLEAFVAAADWEAAAVVLETFSVHRLEPTRASHAAVILGVVRMWEDGVLQRRGVSLAETVDSKRGDSLVVLERILSQRKMRIGLWTNGGVQMTPGDQLTEQGWETEAEERSPPGWMVQRELRDTSYLFSLLRRCANLEEEQWKASLAITRKAILPKDDGRAARLKAFKERLAERTLEQRRESPEKKDSPASRWRCRAFSRVRGERVAEIRNRLGEKIAVGC